MNDWSLMGDIERVGRIKCWHVDENSGSGCHSMSLVVWWELIKDNKPDNLHIFGFCEKHKDEIPSSADFADGVVFECVSEEESALYTIMSS
jgi:hypothetical protein